MASQPPDRSTPQPVLHQNYSYVLDPDISDNASFVELKAYWDRKRGTRAMPTRADIDPVELRSHLGSLALIDVLPGAVDFRLRLIGTKITGVYGRDSTGKNLSELKDTEPQWWRFCDELHRTVATQHRVARARGNLQSVGKPYQYFDLLLLPLAGEDGAVARILAEQLFL